MRPFPRQRITAMFPSPRHAGAAEHKRTSFDYAARQWPSFEVTVNATPVTGRSAFCYNAKRDRAVVDQRD
jgi:hypothetical protein